MILLSMGTVDRAAARLAEWTTPPTRPLREQADIRDGVAMTYADAAGVAETVARAGPARARVLRLGDVARRDPRRRRPPRGHHVGRSQGCPALDARIALRCAPFPLSRSKRLRSTAAGVRGGAGRSGASWPRCRSRPWSTSGARRRASGRGTAEQHAVASMKAVQLGFVGEQLGGGASKTMDGGLPPARVGGRLDGARARRPEAWPASISAASGPAFCRPPSKEVAIRRRSRRVARRRGTQNAGPPGAGLAGG